MEATGMETGQLIKRWRRRMGTILESQDWLEVWGESRNVLEVKASASKRMETEKHEVKADSWVSDLGMGE